MSEAKLRIGWYCPFSLVPLLENNRIQPVRIDWEQYTQGYLGTTKLCKKLTGIHAFIQSTSLDGIILQICCNLSQYVHAYFQSEYSQTPFYLMEIPHKENAYFDQVLYSAWADIEHWIFEMPGKSAIVYDAAGLELGAGEGMEDSRDANPWCRLAEESIPRLKGMERHQQKELLLHETRCPKLISSASRTIPSPTGCEREMSQDGCLLQDYVAVMDS